MLERCHLSGIRDDLSGILEPDDLSGILGGYHPSGITRLCQLSVAWVTSITLLVIFSPEKITLIEGPQ